MPELRRESSTFSASALNQQPRSTGAIVLPRRSVWQRGVGAWVSVLSWANLAAVGLVLFLLCIVSERWWFSAVLGYLPRQLYLVPAAALLVLSLVNRRSAAAINAVSLLLVAGPIMGLSMPVSSPAVAAPGRLAIKIASGNMQLGKGSVRRLMGEIGRFEPDLIVLQEASQGFEPLLEKYADWQQLHLKEFLVLSRYPVRMLDHCKPQAFERWSAVAVEVESPDGPIVVGDVHLMTPRHGADGLTVLSPLTGEGVDEFEWHQRLREDEAAVTRKFFRTFEKSPLLVMGDFNAPTTSSIFTAEWSDLQSAFEAAGWGYGYTSPCNASRLWLTNTPWMRIDHLLANDRWTIESCRIGTTDGSDHRLLFTELRLK
ncbi:MAG: endonuclease/exonuclease/phosphatase family protein [Planctomycetaceae bacterium]